MISGGASVKGTMGPGTTQVGPVTQTKIIINKYVFTKTHDYLLINILKKHVKGSTLVPLYNVKVETLDKMEQKD